MHVEVPWISRNRVFHVGAQKASLPFYRGEMPDVSPTLICTDESKFDGISSFSISRRV